MNNQIDPGMAEEWFLLVGRWKDAQAELDRLDAEDPDYEAKSALTRAELQAIKRKMDELISRAKLSRTPGSTDFIFGSLELSDAKDAEK